MLNFLKVTNKHGSTCELVSIGVFDDTAEGYLTLYGSATTSVSVWKPSHTVLLIANPAWRIGRIATLSLNGNTQLYVHPTLADARYVRALAQRLTKKEHVNPPFPTDAFDVKAAEASVVRVLYKLSEIDEFVRANPRETVLGYISVIITQVHVVTNFKRNMLMGTECCGLPIFANATEAPCKQCGKEVALRINPRIVSRFTNTSLPFINPPPYPTPTQPN